MLKKLVRMAVHGFLAALTIGSLFSVAWAGPPPPPVNASQIPVTPVGGPETSLITAIGIAAYGLLKSRK